MLATPYVAQNPSLGLTYEKIVTPTENLAQTAKNRRYELLNEARQLLAGERVAHCQRGVINVTQPVDVNYSPSRKSASYSNIISCGSVWHCPVCAARISERRRVELQSAVDIWAERGGSTAMLTLTVQHERDEPLPEVLADLTKAQNAFWSGKAAVNLRAKYGIAGRVRALEVTHGGNGWHPHIHILLFLAQELTELELERLENGVSKRWQRIVDNRYERYASFERGAKITFAGGKVSDYVSKFGKDWTAAHELAKATVKTAHGRNRTPNKLLADSLEGDAYASYLWWQYAQAMKGKRQLAWSKGLRKLLGLGEVETDEDLAEQVEPDAMPIARLSRDAWRGVLAHDIRGELLAVAAGGEQSKVREFLEQFSIMDVDYPPWFDDWLDLELNPNIDETARLFGMRVILQRKMELEQ